MRTSTRYSLATLLFAAMMMVAASGLSAQNSTTTRRSTTGSSSSSSSSAATATQRQSTSATQQQSATQRRSTTATQQSATQSASQTTATRSTATQTTGSQNTNTRSSATRTTATSSTATQTTGSQNTNTRSSATQSTRTSAAGASSSTRTTGADAATRTSVTSGKSTTGTTSSTAASAQNVNANVTRRGLTSVSSSAASTSTKGNNNIATTDYRVVNNNVERIAPRERAVKTYSAPKSFYGSDPHYYGWRIQSLPPRPKKVKYFGINYYLYGDVYYRPYGSNYIVCRPPVGVVITKTVKTPFGRVSFSFYTDSYRTYNGWDSYSRYIDEQNRIIAQNNAYIAAQNRAIAMNLSSARSSYDLAYQLGLAQSYAYANWDYYYDDGVFYIINRNGRYEVIVPPAGALVDELPDDYETIILGGMELYRVDDTIYRTVLVSGRPYLEVLGQMYGSLASRYSIYR